MSILTCIVVGGCAGVVFSRKIAAELVVLNIELGTVGAVLAYDMITTFDRGGGTDVAARGMLIELVGATIALALYHATNRRHVLGSGVKRAIRHARAAIAVRRPRPVRHGNA